MQAQLKTDINVIRNNILSFSAHKIQKEIDDRTGWKYCERTLVIAGSKYAIAEFVQTKRRDFPDDLHGMNKKYFMITSKKSFMENKMSFDKIKIINKSDDFAMPYDFKKQCQDIINFDSEMLEDRSVHVTKEEF